MGMFRAKSVEIEAHRWLPETAELVMAMVGKSGVVTKDYVNITGEPMQETCFLLISTVPHATGSMQGLPVGVNTMRCEPGDWVVKHPNGSFSVVKDEVFHDHFEKIAPAETGETNV